MIDLTQYEQHIKQIKEYSIQNGLSETEVNKVFEECFHLLEIKTSTRITAFFKFLKIASISLSLIILCSIVVCNHPTTHSIFLRNVQNFIHPALGVYRKLAIPVITTYPLLTEWYDEWCLVENPYFQVNEMDCWPCSTVLSVQDMTGYNITSTFNTGIPFIRFESTKNVDINTLFKLYAEHKNVFNRDARKVVSNKGFYSTISDVMKKRLDLHASIYKDTHVTWRINRMEPGRLLRQLFTRPIGTPDWWSQSTEKFVFIDESNAAAYEFPNPECANIVVQCTNGQRLIQLNPSTECAQNCKSITILLSAHHTLWYNWWYWRPTSLPSGNTTTISIMYLTSFC